jgi:hypothetical protein
MDDFDFVQCEEVFEDRWAEDDFDIEDGGEF